MEPDHTLLRISKNIWLGYLDQANSVTRVQGVAIPYALPLLLFAALPAKFIANVLCSRRHRELTGICAVCGYDLRASKDRCPDCGRVIESADR